jgi:glycosyltransferase involved in cell wall biosynthesis
MKERIHVLQLIGSTGLYGAERWILALMGGLNPIRIQSTLINLVDRSAEKSEVVDAALQRGLEALDTYTGGRFNPFVAIKLTKWINEHNVHIIHSHGFKSDLVGMLAARLTGCKTVATPHGWSLEKDKKLMIYERLDRVFLRSMDRVCPLSPDLANGIHGRMNNAKLRLILNGVDLDELTATKPVDKFCPNDFLVGYVGQLIESKNVETLLYSLKLLLKDEPRVRLMVIGDGPHRRFLEKEVIRLGIENRVNFMGFRDDAISFLKGFDLFVLPSLSEGIPRCLMEAMASGVPVVATDIPGNRNLVIHGETGLLFSPKDPQDLAKKILYLMSRPKEAKIIALKARQEIEKEFSSKRMADEYTLLYEELMST